MKTDTVSKYFFSCFLLTIPIMVWNILLTNKLPAVFQPETFWKDIPPLIAYGENISRLLVFACTLLMPLRIETLKQKKGLMLYTIGLLLYITSWLIIIYSLTGVWSNSLAGFMAPAYTPLLWLLGIGLIGDAFYFNFPFRPWIFMLIAIVFLVFHNLHTFLIYSRMY